MTAHWGIADPAAATGTDAEVALAFKEAYRMLALSAYEYNIIMHGPILGLSVEF